MVLDSASRNLAIKAKGEGRGRPALLFYGESNELADRAFAGQPTRTICCLISNSCHSPRGIYVELIAIALTAVLCASPRFVAASEILNVAVPDLGAWDSSYTEFGLQQGFFKEEGLDVRITYVADQAALESVLVSGKVDIAVGAGFADILGAWAHGAPVKIISPESTGAPDVFWFGKVVGPVATVADLHGQAVGYAAPGSLTYFILRTLLRGWRR